MSTQISFEDSELVSGSKKPYLTTAACPFVDRFHPLDDWFFKVQEKPYNGELFQHLSMPTKLKMKIEHKPFDGSMFGTAKLYLKPEKLGGSEGETFRIRCDHNEYERSYRITLSGNDQMDSGFLQLLAEEIEPHRYQKP